MGFLCGIIYEKFLLSYTHTHIHTKFTFIITEQREIKFY